VDYHDGARIDLNYSSTMQGVPQGVTDVSAGIDSRGQATVFALDNQHSLWHYDWFNGSWTQLSTNTFKEISATRDGAVYAVTDGEGGLPIKVYEYLPGGGVMNLGTPDGNASGISAGRDHFFGYDEVYAVGRTGVIYVYDSQWGGWTTVDSRFNNNSLDSFTRLSAAQNGDVYALTSKGEIFQETEHRYYSTWAIFTYWSGQQFGAGQKFQAISADTDANGYSEVYAIEVGTAMAYRFNSSGARSTVDYYVSEIAAADGGYFFDVNQYGWGSNYVYSWDPSAAPGHNWNLLGQNIV
jgi:hypothetical protein